MLNVLLETGPTQETVEDTCVKKTLDFVIPNKVQDPAKSPAHEGFQECTHYSPTPGSQS